MTTLISTNPGENYEEIGQIDSSSNEEIIKKVQAANNAKDLWRKVGLKKRIELLQKARNLFKENADNIATLISKEIGTPITESKAEVAWDFGYFDWFLENAEKILAPETTHEDSAFLYQVTYEPLGTAAVITPWNLPFDMFLWGVIPNLLVGNTVVYKASALCALSGKLFEDIMRQVGLPDGVFSEIYGTGEQGTFLAQQDIQLIWFTGSSEVGKSLFELAGKKFVKSIMEMGGSNPAIVFADADIDKVVDTLMFKRYAYCGQACDAVKRVIVEEKVINILVEKLKEKVANLVMGQPDNPQTQLGPVASKKQLETLIAQVDDAVAKGATIIIGGKQPESPSGAYYLPTILTNLSKDMRVWKEEVFGPVLPIVAFDSEEKAIRMANDSPYGLGAQIYTNDRKKALRVAAEIQAGGIDINGTSHFKPFNPFGGYKNSGMGREHGKYGFHELCQLKLISQTK